MTSSDLELAGSLVREAGELAARMRAQGVRTDRKTSVSDVVTDADRAAEELVTRRLGTERPDDGLVGEEGARRAGDRTWFVDPVDGTYNFVSGLPIWCSAVALARGDTPLLGAVYQPSTGELWLGGEDDPTTLDGEPVAPLVDRPLAEVSLASYLHPTRLDDDRRLPVLSVIAGAATVRVLGSGSVELASVAGGRLGAFLQANALPWDWLPGAALVRAAGGRAEVVEHRGQRWHVAGSPRTVDDILAALHV
ncbi:fructose-1,6-bisphosphatase/inositol monophosphatase family enzyme [Friedmanniella endophytica]|uniref:Fructose-1,6-bisphosphatase/inositol monophosphatase family enzyme n=1 Tax=Microlunatus kandeliicorticis TaxID=1759536 RepID=A0A7W3IU93_9ACTN|nr:inositol monophosphatase family protein [Microlunatus kandeliicorticis]MBA8795367.1 fructose-1,6-bisphosphatase/inositol monophosphatase family enzyme [Microlunatus kandeliicorticis]